MEEECYCLVIFRDGWGNIKERRVTVPTREDGGPFFTIDEVGLAGSWDAGKTIELEKNNAS